MLTFKNILKAVNGQTSYSDKDFKLKHVTIDSRNVKSGDVFIAIKGDTFDGHAFIDKAIKSGARLIISEKKLKACSTPWIQVKSTVKALGDVAAFYRSQFDIPIIAITGSVGKTTTKNYIQNVLSSQLRCLASEKSFNNHIGVPLTLLRLTKKHQVAVLELGTNQKGDIAYLAKMVKPTVAILTGFGESHLQGLKNRQGVAKEKMNLCRFLQKKGTIIYNADDSLLTKKVKALRGFAKRSCGIHHKAAFQAQNIRNTLQNKVLFTYCRRSYRLKGVALHNVYGAIIAISCGELFKISYNNINNKLTNLKPPQGRMNLLKSNGLFVIDDTYNANPVSVKAAIDSLEALPVKGKRILILGDMLELGERSRALHLELARYIKMRPIDAVYTLGRFCSHISQYLKSKTSIETRHYQSADKLIGSLCTQFSKGDTVLIKGSRSMHMERVVEGLVQ